MTNSRIGILIEARDVASSQINSVNESLRGMGDAADGGIGGLTGLAGAAGVAVIGLQQAFQAVSGLAEGIFNLAESAAQADRVRGAFDNLAAGVGQSSSEMLAAMQKASGGMISNADLVQAANRAMLLGVADSSDELGKLLEVARVRGAAMGLSVSQAFDDLVTGLGRMSPMILDNLGIMTGGAKVFDQYAASVGKSADELSDAEKKQALFNKVVSETQPLIDQAAQAGGADLAAPFERMNAAIQNAKQALGELFGPAVAVVAQKLADAAAGVATQVQAIGEGAALSDVTAQINFLTTSLERAREGMAQLEADKGTPFFDPQEIINLNATIIEMERQLEAARNRLGDIVGAHDQAAAAAERHSEALLDIGPAGAAAAHGIDLSSEAARGSIPALRDAAIAAAVLAQEFTNASTAMGAARLTQSMAEEAASNQNLDRILKAREEAAKFTNASTEAGQASLRQAIAVQEVNNAIDAHADALREGAKAAKDAAKDEEKAFDDLKNKVSGVLTEALDPGVDVDPEEILARFGLRPDAINENARRLADIAKSGLKGQDWLGEFEQEVPDAFKRIIESSNPQAMAAQLLQEFQQGLRPEFIDKEKAKDLVRQMIIGEQNISQMATEIATELAQEFGAAAPANLNELVSQALGTGATGAGAGVEGGAQAGADAATSFAQSFVSAASTVGTQIANSLKAENVISLIRDAGKLAGQNWGDMFLSVVGDHVPESLVSLLTDLVTPNVQARLAAQASLTGAK